jgi:hypothetical protein
MTASDVGMPIETAAQFSLTVVEVKSSDLPQANDPIELAHGLAIGRLRTEGIAGSKDMTCIKTDPESLGILHTIQDLSQVFEPMA